MSALKLLIVAAVAAVVLSWPSPASAQESGDITVPDEWAAWDSNQDGVLAIDEYTAMSQADRDALQTWIDDTLDAVDDNDFRDWADDHFDFQTRFFYLDIPSEGIGDSIRDAPGDIRDAVSGAAGNLARGAADSAFDAVANRVGEASADLTGFIGEELAQTGVPQLEADWYQEHYQRMLGWAGLLLLPLAGVGIGSAVVRGDSSKVGYTLMQVPVAYLMGVLALSVIAASTGLAAAMARSLTPGMQESSREIGERVTELMVVGRMGSGLVLLLGLLIAIAALMTLMWLLLAEAAIYAVVLFIPIAFAGRVWEPAREWGRKLMTVAFSLVAAKVVIFAVWALAVDGLAELTRGDVPLRSAIALAALLMMTALAPTAALRLVPMLEGVERAGSPGAAARSGLSSGYYAAGIARMTSRGGGGGRSAGGPLAVTGQIGGAAARAPAGAGRSQSDGSGVPVGRSPGRDGGPRAARTTAGRRDQSAGRRPEPAPGRSSNPAPPEGPSRPAPPSSADGPRVTPPALPPGRSGQRWRRPDR